MGLLTIRIDETIHGNLRILKDIRWGCKNQERTTIRKLAAKLLEERIEEEFKKYIEIVKSK